MTWTEQGRWTCPHATCGHTFTAYGSADDTAAAIAAVQVRHGTEHRKAAAVARKIRWAERDRGAA